VAVLRVAFENRTGTGDYLFLMIAPYHLDDTDRSGNHLPESAEHPLEPADHSLIPIFISGSLKMEGL